MSPSPVEMRDDSAELGIAKALEYLRERAKTWPNSAGRIALLTAARELSFEAEQEKRGR